MPVFDYRCTECHSVYDVFHKGKEVVEDIVCPSCGSSKYKKLMSIPTVSTGSTSSNSGFDGGSSCGTGGCCSGGACGFN